MLRSNHYHAQNMDAMAAQAEELKRVGTRGLRLPPSYTPDWPGRYEPLRGCYDLRERNAKGAPVRIKDGWDDDTIPGGAAPSKTARPIRQTLEGLSDLEVQATGMNGALSVAHRDGKL